MNMRGEKGGQKPRDIKTPEYNEELKYFLESFYLSMKSKLIDACHEKISIALKHRGIGRDTINICEEMIAFIETLSNNVRFTFKRATTDKSSRACYFHPLVPRDVVVYVPVGIEKGQSLDEKFLDVFRKALVAALYILIEQFDRQVLFEILTKNRDYANVRGKGESVIRSLGGTGGIPNAIPEALSQFHNPGPELETVVSEGYTIPKCERTAYIPDDFSLKHINPIVVEQRFKDKVIPKLKEWWDRKITFEQGKPDVVQYNKPLGTIKDFDEEVRYFSHGAALVKVFDELKSKVKFILMDATHYFSDGDSNPFIRSVSFDGSLVSSPISGHDIIHGILLDNVIEHFEKFSVEIHPIMSDPDVPTWGEYDTRRDKKFLK